MTFSFADQTAMTASRVERQLADDRKRILVANYPPIREGANRRGRVVVEDLPPDDLAALPNGNHMTCHPLLRAVHQGLGMVKDRQPVERHTEQQNLPVCLD